MRTDYIRFDTYQDVEASLELVVFALQNLGRSKAHYKSAVLNAHLALQGMCVCALTATDGGGALANKSEKALRTYHDQCSLDIEAFSRDWLFPKNTYPTLQLAALGELLKRLPRELYSDSERGAKSQDPRRSLDRLSSLRNSFSHFTDLSWSISPMYIEEALLGGMRFVSRFPDLQEYFANRSRLNEARVVSLIEEAMSLLERK